MAEFNTVWLSGVLTGDVDTYKKQGLQVARFYIDVEGAGDGRLQGNFKVVAFGNHAEVAMKDLQKGSRVLIMGALLERRRGGRGIEIRVRRLLLLPAEAPEAEREEFRVTDIDEDDEQVPQEETED